MEENKLIDTLVEELKNHSENMNVENNDFKDYCLMGLIVNHFKENIDFFSDEFVEKVLSQSEPLMYLVREFKEYVEVNNIFFDVFEDVILNDHANKEDIQSIFIYEDIEDDDYEEDEEYDEDDEGVIHDNEDC